MDLSHKTVEELISIAYEANNHARRLVNKYCPEKNEYDRVDRRANWLSENVADNNQSRMVKSNEKCSCGSEIPPSDPYDGYCVDCG